MAVLWPTFQAEVSTWLDTTSERDEMDTANKIAGAYHSAVQTAMITLVPGSTIITTPPPNAMATAIYNTFNQIKQSERVSNPQQFLGWANSIVAFWQAVQWNPIPPPLGYISPTTGHTVISGGTPTPLNIGLWNAFNNVPSQVPMGNVISTKLISAFTTHLLTITGVYNGIIPAVPSPVPGPPFPWVGVV